MIPTIERSSTEVTERDIHLETYSELREWSSGIWTMIHDEEKSIRSRYPYLENPFRTLFEYLYNRYLATDPNNTNAKLIAQGRLEQFIGAMKKFGLSYYYIKPILGGEDQIAESPVPHSAYGYTPDLRLADLRAQAAFLDIYDAALQDLNQQAKEQAGTSHTD